MTYRVEVTREAQAEALETFVWKGENYSVAKAIEWYNGLIDQLSSLEEMPGRCPLAPENSEFEDEIRQLLYGARGDQYRILYTIRNREVYILHIRHSAMGRLQPDA